MPAGRAFTTISTDAAGKQTTRQAEPVVPKEQTKDRQAQAMQESIRQATAAARASPEGQGSVYITGLTFTGGTARTIPHKLGRKFTRVQLYNPVGGYLAWQLIKNNPASLDSVQVQIQCQNTVTCDVEIA